MSSSPIRAVFRWLVWIVCVLIGFVIYTARADEQPKPQVTGAVLARVPPKSPQEALACFEVADGFRIELVAAEPLVVDPVAMAFDEHGRLYVVEMRDYSEQDKERLGRVRLLSDTDGDGEFDTSRVFVEGLSWPTAVTCYDGGVFIGIAPDILYCKDTNGDGVADERRVVFTGFGRGNVQGLLNSFQWGLDHRIYGATSSAGARITRASATPSETNLEDVKESEALELHGRDFAFDPKSLVMEPITGGGQHGSCLNRWGDRFVCSNSDHLQAIVFEDRYLSRNPFQSVLSARRSIAADGPQAAVFRISPVEAWRIARTKLRVAGLAPGPIEGGGQPAGYFTSATGVTVYDGGLWGHDNGEWVYVADVGSNLIHRKLLSQDGVTYRGERVDKQSEFVRSTDIWFRPVQMAVGPEGALYVADMYREVIEHPASLPPELKQQLDLTSGNDRGRIYRIVPADYKQVAIRPLVNMDTGQLVAALDDPNSWRRITALRLLYERQDSSAVELLRALLSNAQRPEGRIAALHALESLRALQVSDLVVGLHDPHPQVRRYALKLSEPLLRSSPELCAEVIALAADRDPVVQFQLTQTLGECDDSRTPQTLARILVQNSAQQDIADAALSSLHTGAGQALRALLASDDWISRPEAETVLSALARQIVRQRNESDLEALAAALSPNGNRVNAKAQTGLLLALAKLPPNSFQLGSSPALENVQQLRRSAAAQIIRDAQRTLKASDVLLPRRLAAIEQLQLGSFENEREVLTNLFSPQEPPAIHLAALATCATYDAPAVADLILSQWSALAPAERSQATEVMLRREAWVLALLRHLQENRTPLATLDPRHVERIENFPSTAVRQLSQSLRSHEESQDRREIFRGYHDVITANGDPARGKLVFQKNCSTCHELESSGHAVGPNLAAMVSRGTESLLFNILVPNGEVDPRYLEYVVLTIDGQVITGIIAGESSAAITLRGADNKTTTILRVDIDELRNTGKSLMPEGFERTIDKQAMADLLTYLNRAAVAEGTSR